MVRKRRRGPVRILFAGYAPVHFVCFRPIYEWLGRFPGIEVYLSGGREIGREGRVEYDARALYEPFGIPSNRVLPLDRMRPRTFDIVFSAHTSGFLPRSPCAKVQIFHGVSFRNVAIREKQSVYDYFFMIGPYMRRAFARRRILRHNDPRTLEIGFPKLDRLVNGSLDRDEILSQLGLKPDRPTLLYAPTGWKYNSLETMGEEVIRRLKAGDRYNLLVKPHDHPDRPIDWFARLRKYQGPRVRLIRDYDVVPYLYVADLLISDASSVSSEFSLLDRPIVFLDVPKLLARARRKGTMLDLATYGRKGGITVRQPQDVPGVVRWFLAHPGYRGSVRRAMARDLFYHPGRATDRAVSWILEYLVQCGRYEN